MSSGEQPIRSFVEGGSGVAGFRVQWGSSTAPASGGTPNASRSRRRRGESRQRVECGGLPPLCEASGVEAGLPTGCYHHRVTHRCSVLEREEAAARGETVAQQGGRSAGTPAAEKRSGFATAEGRAALWGGGDELRGGFVSVPVDRRVLKSGQGGRFVGFGDPLTQRVPAPAVPSKLPCQGIQRGKCGGCQFFSKTPLRSDGQVINSFLRFASGERGVQRAALC